MGALLLALDRCVEGGVRERSVVAYYRHRGGAQVLQGFNPLVCLGSGAWV